MKDSPNNLEILYTYMCVCIYMYMHTHIYTHIHIYTLYTYVYIYKYMYTNTYMHIYAHTCMTYHIYMCVCVPICMNRLQVYVCIYSTHTWHIHYIYIFFSLKIILWSLFVLGQKVHIVFRPLKTNYPIFLQKVYATCSLAFKARE